MCLRSVTKVYEKPKNPIKWSVGYKCFNINRSNNKVFLVHQYLPDMTSNLEFNKVYKSSTDTIGYRSGVYPAGFHIFPIQMAAKLYDNHTYTIFKVKYRKIVAEGTHSIYTINFPVDCIIAREMQIIEEISDEELKNLQENETKIRKIYKRSSRRRKR